jgi:hypothetical protein
LLNATLLQNSDFGLREIAAAGSVRETMRSRNANNGNGLRGLSTVSRNRSLL